MRSLLLCVFFMIPFLGYAQERVNRPNKRMVNISTKNAFAAFKKEDVRNPQVDAGKLLVKATHMKYAAMGCAAASAGMWVFIKKVDDCGVNRLLCAVGGIASVAFYVTAIRYEWKAGKCLQVSASPGGITASVKF